MDVTEVVCPECGELNLIEPEDFAELAEGDVLECEGCGAFLEVIRLDPLEVEVTDDVEEGYFVVCPRCGHENEAVAEGEDVECESCGHTFTPDWSEVDLDDDIDDDRLHHEEER